MRSGLRRPAARERAALLSGSSRRSFWPRARALSTAAVTRKMQSKFIDDELKPDFATKVDCSQIRDFGIPFIHGAEDFLVIESALPRRNRERVRSRALTSSRYVSECYDDA